MCKVREESVFMLCDKVYLYSIMAKPVCTELMFISYIIATVSSDVHKVQVGDSPIMMAQADT